MRGKPKIIPAYPSEDLDAEGYPTDEALEFIAKFNLNKFSTRLLVMYVSSIWKYLPDDFSLKYKRKVNLSTYGWSGNEDIVEALQRNLLFWSYCYHSHTTGGHWTFRLREFAKTKNQ